MSSRKKAAADATQADVRTGGILTDDGGRPVTDEGGRPVFSTPAGELVLDNQHTPPVGAVTATGTNAPPAQG